MHLIVNQQSDASLPVVDIQPRYQLSQGPCRQPWSEGCRELASFCSYLPQQNLVKWSTLRLPSRRWRSSNNNFGGMLSTTLKYGLLLWIEIIWYNSHRFAQLNSMSIDKYQSIYLQRMLLLTSGFEKSGIVCRGELVIRSRNGLFSKWRNFP